MVVKAYNGTIVEGNRKITMEDLNFLIEQIESDNRVYFLERMERKERNRQRRESKMIAKIRRKAEK